MCRTARPRKRPIQLSSSSARDLATGGSGSNRVLSTLWGDGGQPEGRPPSVLGDVAANLGQEPANFALPEVRDALRRSRLKQAEICNIGLEFVA